MQSSLESESAPKHKQTRPRRWLRRLGISLVSLSLALVAAEIILRTIWPVGGCVLGLDEELLFAPIPNTAHVQFMKPSLASLGIVVRVNSQGMLGPEPDETRSRPRWMVFGDSFVMSENEPFDKTFTAQLADQWKDKIELLCAGVTGYGPDQTLMRMEKLLPIYEPEGIVLVLCGYNDLGDPMRNRMMRLGENGELVRSKATVNLEEQKWFNDNLEESRKLGLVRLWLNYHEVKSWGAPLKPDGTLMADYLRAHREDYTAHVEENETVALGLLRDVYDADVALKPDWPSSQYKIRLMERILAEIKTLSDSRGIPIVAVVVPGGPDMDPESWLRIDTKRYPEYKRDGLSNTITEVSEQAGITTLNLFSAFDERARQDDLYVGPVDPHWNANGMRLGAEVCARFMADKGILAVE